MTKMKKYKFFKSSTMHVEVYFSTKEIEIEVPGDLHECEIIDWLKENQPQKAKEIDNEWDRTINEVHSQLGKCDFEYAEDGGDDEEHFDEVEE